jgi:hypothetical protein
MGLYCQTPAGLAAAYPVLVQAFDIGAGGHGATPDVMDFVYGQGCGLVRSLPLAKITETREFRTKQGVATLVNVSFGHPLSVMCHAGARTVRAPNGGRVAAEQASNCNLI